jgi:hypothetical protein
MRVNIWPHAAHLANDSTFASTDTGSGSWVRSVMGISNPQQDNEQTAENESEAGGLDQRHAVTLNCSASVSGSSSGCACQ